MATTLTEISGPELMRRIMAGERDFASTRISAAENTLADRDGLAQFNAYLAGQNLREEPIIGTSADWQGLKAPGVLFTGSKLSGANLSQADLSGADFRRGDLSGANLHGANVSGSVFVGCRLMGCDFTDASMRGADLYEANLSDAHLANADLARAFMLRLNLTGADLTGAQLTGVTFYRADLRRVIGLDATRDLASCQFKHTIVTARERDIIEASFQSEPRFDLRDE